MILCGCPGRGKTHFCSALTHWALNSFASFRYFHEKTLLEKIREGMDKYQGDYITNLKYLVDDPLLILDDVGSQGVNEWREEIFFNVLDQRYCSELPTVITSNFSKHDFQTNYHERVASRLFATENTIIELTENVDLRLQGL